MSSIEKKNFNHPESTKVMGKTKVDSIEIGGHVFTRVTVEPGWRWSIDIKPVAKTETCQIGHLIYVLSGKIHTVMNDGKELDLSAGDMVSIAPGHDGWNVGDEPAVWIEIPHGEIYDIKKDWKKNL